MFTYIQSEPQLWTVGHYDPSGKFVPESDWGTPKEAGDRVRELNGGPPMTAPAPTPSADARGLDWWIANHEQQCRTYMNGLNSIQEDMETRDYLMRREVEWEQTLKACEAGAILNADDPTGLYAMAKATNDKKRDAALVMWKRSDGDYQDLLRTLDGTRKERSRLEASIRARELACSLIKRDIDFSTAVVNALGRGL